MNILSKLLTALRGAVTEAGEEAIDTHAIKILEQEMREASDQLDIARNSLTEVIAEQMGVQRQVRDLQQSIEEHEGYANQALAKGDENLALEIADKMAALINEKEAIEAVESSYSANVEALKEAISDTERKIKAMDRELAVVKTTESVQKANEAVALKFSGTNTSLRSATESLQRVKEKQQKKADQMQAALTLQKQEEGVNLQQKLQDAGIVSAETSGVSVLERLKAKRLEQ